MSELLAFLHSFLFPFYNATEHPGSVKKANNPLAFLIPLLTGVLTLS